MGLDLKPEQGGTLIVLGGAACVWEDYHHFYHSRHDYHHMAVNDIGMHFPYHLHHWYSNSAGELRNWAQCRRRDLNQDFQTHTFKQCHDTSGVKHVHDIPGHGTSPLNAVYIGLKYYEKVIICGVPLDESPNYFSPYWEKRHFRNEVPDKDGGLKYWNNLLEYKGRVFSMSGRTRDLLGSP